MFRTTVSAVRILVKRTKESPVLASELLNFDAQRAATFYKIENLVHELLDRDSYIPTMQNLRDRLTATQNLQVK